MINQIQCLDKLVSSSPDLHSKGTCIGARLYLAARSSQSTSTSNLYSWLCNAVGLSIVHTSTTGKAPGPIHNHTNIETATSRARDSLDAPIFDLNSFGCTLHNAHVHIASTR